MLNKYNTLKREATEGTKVPETNPRARQSYGYISIHVLPTRVQRKSRKKIKKSYSTTELAKSTLPSRFAYHYQQLFTLGHNLYYK